MKKCTNPKCVLGAYSGDLFMDDDNYCSECGGKLASKEELNCRCGHHLGHSDKFCSGCGRKTEEALKKD